MELKWFVCPLSGKQHKSEFHQLIEKVRGHWNSGKRKIKEEPIEEGSYEGECSTGIFALGSVITIGLS